jgi:hypothetical protein
MNLQEQAVDLALRVQAYHKALNNAKNIFISSAKTQDDHRKLQERMVYLDEIYERPKMYQYLIDVSRTLRTDGDKYIDQVGLETLLLKYRPGTEIKLYGLGFGPITWLIIGVATLICITLPPLMSWTRGLVDANKQVAKDHPELWLAKQPKPPGGGGFGIEIPWWVWVGGGVLLFKDKIFPKAKT